MCAACKGYFHGYCVDNVRCEDRPGHWFCISCFEKQMNSILPFLNTLKSHCTKDPSCKMKNMVDALFKLLEIPEHQMDLLASSTGELLVHLSKLDLPKELEVIKEVLSQDNGHSSSSLWSHLINVMDASHRLESGLSQIQRTVESLKKRWSSALNESNEQMASLENDLIQEGKAREDTLDCIQRLSKIIPEMKSELKRSDVALDAIKSNHEVRILIPLLL